LPQYVQQKKELKKRVKSQLHEESERDGGVVGDGGDSLMTNKRLLIKR